MDWTEQELSDQTILMCFFLVLWLTRSVLNRYTARFCTRYACVPYRGGIYLNERRLHN